MRRREWPLLLQHKGQLCSHIIWVYLHVLKVKEDDSRIHQIALTASEVKSLLSGSSTSQSHGTNCTNHGNTWRLERLQKQRGVRPKCKGCTKQLGPGSVVVAVNGLYKPETKNKDGNSFDVPAVFRFCPNETCISKKPPRSNLQFPLSRILWKQSDLVLTTDELEQVQTLPQVVWKP